MIHVSTALSFERVGKAPPKSLPKLTDEQEINLDYADSVVESLVFSHFDGDMFGTPVPASFLPIIEHLKQRYLDGGWSVGVFPQRQGDEVKEILLAFAPRGTATATKEAQDNRHLPAIAPPVSSFVRGACLLVRMPTRGRPAQALRVLQAYRDMAGMPIAIEVIIDADDETMNTAPVLQRLCALGCKITVGHHGSKVEAVNGGRARDWDVLLLASDDMVPVVPFYAIEIMLEMEKHWPNLDGAIYFNDGYARERCCTLPIIGRRWYDGKVYERAYQSLCCDVEQTELWKAQGKLVYVDRMLIEHRHPATGKAGKDELYERNDALHSADMEVYERRKRMVRPHSQFRFNAPPMWLSVMIATVPERKAQLDNLLSHLFDQVDLIPRGMVEVLVDGDGGTIGEKRQRLLERAKGHFVAFIDDDDWVSHDYVLRLVEALAENPDADCASLAGEMTTQGDCLKKIEHSLKHRDWEQRGSTHLRSPNHLNAIKREIALQVGFGSMAHGEDHDFSKRILPLLHMEAPTGDRPLYYYFFNP